jgi:catechol 2,3-dioxygenase-like lactoylglutathione lyase family enzyme
MNDELERLIAMYDGGHLDRRQLLRGLLGLGLGTGAISSRSGLPMTSAQRKPLFRTQTINHVTIRTADVARSKAFYQSLTGLAVRDEDKDFCEFRLTHGFLGLYALEAGQHAGYDHFCLGVDGFDAPRALAVLESAMPEAQPTLETGDQIYLRDPDGVRVQLADVKYKR